MLHAGDLRNEECKERRRSWWRFRCWYPCDTAQGVTDAGGPISGAACLPWRIVSQEEKEEEERVSS